MQRAKNNQVRGGGFCGKIAGARGQMVVEYVLLLLASVFVATLLINLMVSRSADSQGFIIIKWRQLIEFVADDQPDDL